MQYLRALAAFIGITFTAATAAAVAVESFGNALAKRGATWYSTTAPQNFCGYTTFAIQAGGPVVANGDCEQLLEQFSTGYWVVGPFTDSDYTVVAQLDSCSFEARRNDGKTNTIYIGNTDVVDLINSVMSGYGDGTISSNVVGEMGCAFDGDVIAGVEWQVIRP